MVKFSITSVIDNIEERFLTDASDHGWDFEVPGAQALDCFRGSTSPQGVTEVARNINRLHDSIWKYNNIKTEIRMIIIVL